MSHEKYHDCIEACDAIMRDEQIEGGPRAQVRTAAGFVVFPLELRG